MSYEKPKRKNEDLPNLFSTLLKALWRYGVIAPLRGLWWLGRQSAHGLWWVTKNTFQLVLIVSMLAISIPVYSMRWMWRLIMGISPEFETQRENNIYRLIRRRYRRRNFFTFHALIYVLSLVTGSALLIDRYNHLLTARVDPWLDMGWAAVAGLLWTMILAFHFVRLKSGENEDRDLHEALEREYNRQAQPPVQEAYYHPRLALDEYVPDEDHSLEVYQDSGGHTGKRKR